MKRLLVLTAWLILPVLAQAGDFAALCADRAAVERVYHAHRLGTKPPFEEAMPQALLERLVREDTRKESVLRKAYGVEITPALLDAEVARIAAVTRAPEMLAEIKHALGGDAGRFARSVAQPIVVERELRSRFDNDDRLHAEKRREAEQARAALLAGRPVADLREVTWQLTARPEEDREAGVPTPPPQAKGVARSGAYSVEATAQIAQVIAAPGGDADKPEKQKQYFEDLDPQLQNVLRVQLQKPGDVSAVIEMPTGFLIFQAKARTATALQAASLSIHKRSYEEWLAAQPQ